MTARIYTLYLLPLSFTAMVTCIGLSSGLAYAQQPMLTAPLSQSELDNFVPKKIELDKPVDPAVLQRMIAAQTGSQPQVSGTAAPTASAGSATTLAPTQGAHPSSYAPVPAAPTGPAPAAKQPAKAVQPKATPVAKPKASPAPTPQPTDAETKAPSFLQNMAPQETQSVQLPKTQPLALPDNTPATVAAPMQTEKETMLPSPRPAHDRAAISAPSSPEPSNERTRERDIPVTPAIVPVKPDAASVYRPQGSAQGPSVKAAPVETIGIEALTPSEKVPQFFKGLNIAGDKPFAQAPLQANPAQPTAPVLLPQPKAIEDLPATIQHSLPKLDMPDVPTLPEAPAFDQTADAQNTDLVEIERTVPQSAISVPTLSDLTVVFSGESIDIDLDGVRKLDGVFEELNTNENRRLHIHAYASGIDGDIGSARSIALSRGLAVRKYLIDKGLRPAQLKVKAYGSQTDRTPVDRTDLIFAAE